MFIVNITVPKGKRIRSLTEIIRVADGVLWSVQGSDRHYVIKDRRSNASGETFSYKRGIRNVFPETSILLNLSWAGTKGLNIDIETSGYTGWDVTTKGSTFHALYEALKILHDGDFHLVDDPYSGIETNLYKDFWAWYATAIRYAIHMNAVPDEIEGNLMLPADSMRKSFYGDGPGTPGYLPPTDAVDAEVAEWGRAL